MVMTGRGQQSPNVELLVINISDGILDHMLSRRFGHSFSQHSFYFWPPFVSSGY